MAIGKLCRSLKEEINLQEKIYSIEDVVRMIQDGTIGIATDIIKGVHGAQYVRAPYNEIIDNYDGYFSIFILEDKEHTIPTVNINGVEWYQFAPILNMLSLNNLESDARAMEALIPHIYRRLLTFKGHGYRRTYVCMEALEAFGISPDKKVTVKKKVNLFFPQIVTFKVDLKYLREKTKEIMNKLPEIEDKIFMTDVYRILSQLE